MKSAGFLIIVLIFMACDPGRLYEENYELDNRIWYVDSIPVFQFIIPENEKAYDVSLNVRNTRSYPFQNIYITYYLEDTVGNVLETDLINYQLFDEKTGRPLGKGGLGDIYDHRFPILDNYKFSQEGVYNLRLQQYMRKDSLPEIIAVGVRVEENNKAN